MVTLKFCKESAVASSGFGSLPKRAKCDAGGCGHTHTNTHTHIQAHLYKMPSESLVVCSETLQTHTLLPAFLINALL